MAADSPPRGGGCVMRRDGAGGMAARWRGRGAVRPFREKTVGSQVTTRRPLLVAGYFEGEVEVARCKDKWQRKNGVKSKRMTKQVQENDGTRQRVKSSAG